MIKVARKQSNDPVQEKLRSKKDSWNAATKELINRIIAFKRAINGRGDAKYSLPTSKIQDPFENEVISFLNNLASNFEAVTSEAAKIIADQEAYSKSRQQPKPKVASLNVEASNKFTRMWAYIKSPFLSDENKKLRISLLKMMAEIDKLLKDLEGEALSFSDNSIKNMEISVSKIENKIAILSQTFSSLINIDNEKESDIINNGDADSDVNDLIKDLYCASNVDGISSEIISRIVFLTGRYKSAKDNNHKKVIGEQIIVFHKNLLDKLNSENKTNYTKISDFMGVIKNPVAPLVPTKNVDGGENEDADLNKVAANFVTKWLKKQIHENNPFDSTSSSRLGIYESIKDIRSVFDQLMSELESKLDPNSVKSLLLGIIQLFKTLKSKLKPLSNYIEVLKYDKFNNLIDSEKSLKDKYKMQEKEKKDFERKIRNKINRDLLSVDKSK